MLNVTVNEPAVVVVAYAVVGTPSMVMYISEVVLVNIGLKSSLIPVVNVTVLPSPVYWSSTL